MGKVEKRRRGAVARSEGLPSHLAVSIDCDECDQEHLIDLSVTYKERPDLGLVFAGPESDKNAVVQWVVKYECPNTHAGTSTTVRVPVDRKHQVDRVVAEVASETLSVARPGSEPPDSAASVEPPATKSWVEQELEHLRSASLETGRGFGTTMIATCTTAIGLYFVVLKYLGFDNIGGPVKNLTVAPPILLLLAAVAFAAAIRPVLSSPSSLAEFEAYWRKRVRTMNALVVLGMALFLLGVAVAIPIFLAELR